MKAPNRPTRTWAAIVCAAAVLSLPLVAQQALDRTKVPPPGKPPVLRVPTWTKTTLASGAELIVSEKHELPLVSFSLTLLGGASQFEPTDRRGLASMAASMMSEGTKTRDGEALSSALQMLGTSVGSNIGSESGSLSFMCTTDKFAPTLDILADMLVNSVFPADALERIRAQRLVALTQAKAQPGSIASRVFPRVVYGPAHPFGQVPTEQSLRAITRDEIVVFAKQYYRPGRALVVVTGDVRAADVKATLDRAFAAWPAGGSRPDFSYPAPATRQTPTIFLVDKPNAAQSTFAIGNPGPPRRTPDYYALEVMNAMLGGLFQSRLNANIREEKGFSYGVRSWFAYGRGPGAFRAGGDIISEKTDVALVEFMKELKGIAGSRPVTDEELATAKNSLVQSLPSTFERVSGIAGALSSLWINGLPDDYYQRYGQAVGAVTKEDVVRVARQYIDLPHLAIVIVGDRARIEAPLKATGIGPIVVLDVEGNPTAPASASARYVIRPVVNMYSSATTDADVVSQAIYATPVTVLEEKGEWANVRTPDDYTGWVEAAALLVPKSAAGYASGSNVVQVRSLFSHIYREADVTKHAPLLTVPFETKLEMDGENAKKSERWLQVRLPDGRTGLIQNADVGPPRNNLTVTETIALAKKFMGLPYTWGGSSSYGFDCSGFMQMLMRQRGYVMPRDAGPQAEWSGLTPVEKAQLQPGDLLYFGSSPKRITHTGMYIGDGLFINATTHETPMVRIDDLNDAYWTRLLVASRRVK